MAYEVISWIKARGFNFDKEEDKVNFTNKQVFDRKLRELVNSQDELGKRKLRGFFNSVGGRREVDNKLTSFIDVVNEDFEERTSVSIENSDSVSFLQQTRSEIEKSNYDFKTERRLVRKINKRILEVESINVAPDLSVDDEGTVQSAADYGREIAINEGRDWDRSRLSTKREYVRFALEIRGQDESLANNYKG